MKLHLMFILMDLLVLIAIPTVFLLGKLRQFIRTIQHEMEK